MPARQLAIVIPVHNEAPNVEPLVERLRRTAASLPGWEVRVLFVDDGSTDDTVSRIEAMRRRGVPLGCLRFSRNFGHQPAIEAGLRAAGDADAAITMDGDLQHPPEEIPGMLRLFEEGADVVHMVRRHPAPGGKGFLSRQFYAWFARLSRTEIVPDAADFRLISRRVLDVLNRIPEREKFLRALIPSLGFRQATAPFDEAQRHGGAPSYTFRASWRLARRAIFDYSALPLLAVFWLGSTLAIASFLFGIGHIVVKLVAWQRVAPGFTDLITAVLFLSGCILAALGIVGRYLVTILEQLRGRPSFVVMDRLDPQPLPPPDGRVPPP
jgi:glycosyltransferase involved in cell wall biosynthesis